MVIEIILGLVVITEGYVIWNLMKKTELLDYDSKHDYVHHDGIIIINKNKNIY